MIKELRNLLVKGINAETNLQVVPTETSTC